MSTPQNDALALRLKAASDAYYNGAPILSDAAFDALEAQLKAADPNHQFFKTVGAPATSSAWKKVKHGIPMGSLNKAQNEADLRKWWPGHPVCITHKLDGISVVLSYKDRKLVQAATRGDGTIGEDITRNVLMMKGALKQLPKHVNVLGHVGNIPDVVYVRGEIICRKTDFAAQFPGESNPRNTASGTAKRRSNADKCRHLTVVAYQYLPDGEAPQSKQLEIGILDDMGFTTPNNYVVADVASALAVYQQYIDTDRDSLDWEIDGLVIDVNSKTDREALGSHNMRPKGAIALKFPYAQKETILRGIRWQVGNSGRITPVALFDTVNLAGANVSQASLHNLANITRLLENFGLTPQVAGGTTYTPTLTVGMKILAARRGDVIPYFEEILEDIPLTSSTVSLRAPDECPECQTPTTMKGEYLICPNGDTCPAQVSGAIKRWIKKVNVLHFGETLIGHLCETGQISAIHHLYELDVDTIAAQEINGRKIGGSATRAFKNLHKKDNMVLPLSVFIGSLGIEFIGRSMTQTLIDAGFDSLNAMSKATVPDIAAIPGVGQRKALSFCDGFWDRLDDGTITELLRVGIKVKKPATGPLKGTTVCMTGFRDAALMTAIEGAGGVVKSGVSKGLSILVTKDPNSQSGKAVKARRYGTEVIGIQAMWDRIN